MSIRLNDKIKKTHFENFPGDGRVLYVRDPLEEEEAMYAYRGQDLVRQNGYYIYYIKNKEMQEYLIDRREEQKAAISYERMMEQKRDEQIVRQSRKRLLKQQEKSEHRVKRATAAAFAMFLIGASVTYFMFGEEAVPKQAVLTISDRLKEIGSTKAVDIQGEEKVSAVFTASTSAQQEEAGAKVSKDTYIVQRGDTLIKISKALLGSKEYVRKIMDENGLKPGDSIYPGQELKIPVIK